MEIQELYQQITKHFDEVIQGVVKFSSQQESFPWDSESYELGGREWTVLEVPDTEYRHAYFVTAKKNIDTIEQVTDTLEKNAACTIRSIYGFLFFVTLRIRQDNRSYIMIRKEMINKINISGKKDLPRYALSFASGKRENRSANSNCAVIIYEGDFDIQTYHQNNKQPHSKTYRLPATLYQLNNVLKLIAGDDGFFSPNLVNSAQPIINCILDYYKTHYQETNPQIAERIDKIENLLKKQYATILSKGFSHIPLWQYIFSKDTDTFCRTLGVEPIPYTELTSDYLLVDVCKTAKLIEPDARDEYYQYLLTNKNKFKADARSGSGINEDTVQRWVHDRLFEDRKQYEDLRRQTTTTMNLPCYMQIKQSMREKIPLLNTAQEWLDEYKEVIYRKAVKNKRAASATLETLDALPQIKRLDAEFAKGIDRIYKIERVRTYDDFIKVCCEFYLDPQTIFHELCYIIDDDEGGSYLLVIPRKSNKGFNIELSAVSISILSARAHGSEASLYDFKTDIQNIVSKINSAFGVKSKKYTKSTRHIF